MFHHFRRLLEIAQTECIDIIPLKGAHLLSHVYPAHEDRGTIADVDFLVKPKDWNRTIELMEEYGFHRRSHFADESKRYEIGFYYDLPGDKSMLFEVHQQLFCPKRFPMDHQAIWRRAYPSDFDGVPCLRMADEDVFCHVAWHSAIHRFMRHGRTLRDLELILEHAFQQPNFEQMVKNIVERAKQWRCTKVIWLYLSLLTAQRDQPSSLSCNKTLVQACERLSPPVHIKTALHFFIGPQKKTRFSSLHHRVQAALIWPLIFDKKRELLRMVIHHPKSPWH